MEQKLNALATKLFREFARFEYSLKVVGFHNGDGDAKPNWRSFAKAIPVLFNEIEDNELKIAVNYFRQNPPRKQIIEAGQLDWDDTEPQTDLEIDRILIYVRRVRNNLFHGGKFNGRWFAPQRSEQLLSHSLTILKACREASPDVNDAYHHSA